MGGINALALGDLAKKQTDIIVIWALKMIPFGDFKRLT